MADRWRLTPALALAVAALGVWLALRRRRARIARVGEALLGVGLGALALALRLHAPVPVLTADEPTLLTLTAAPRSSGPVCQLRVWLHGPTPGRALLRAPAASCEWLPGQHALGRMWLEELPPATNPGVASVR